MKIEGCRVAAAMVVYHTYGLMRKAVASVRRFYPDIDFFVVDNTEGVAPRNVRKWAKRNRVRLIRVGSNIGHGPGMNVALWATEADVLLMLDSDTEMYEPNLLEDALAKVGGRKTRWYGIGPVAPVKRPVGGEKVSYLHSSTCLFHVGYYRRFEPFTDHGLALVAPMYELRVKRMESMLVDFPVQDYVHHLWRGTRDFCRGHQLDRSYESRKSASWWEPGKF